MKSVLIDLQGKRFGKLTVLERGENDKKHVQWVCECDCGKVKLIRGNSLKTGRTKSCGCLRNEPHGVTHGLSGSPEHIRLTNIKSRCYNKNNPDYHNYGGRGISVCDRWLGKDGLLNFIEDMGFRPSKDVSLDRIDPNGPYSPENCRWADIFVQALNKNKRVGGTSPYRGVWWSKSNNKWVAQIGVRRRQISLGTFLNEVDAAKAYDKAAREQGYEEAWLNFPKEEANQ